MAIPADDVLAGIVHNQANVALMRHRHDQALTLAERSVALHESAGFREIGRYREVGYKSGAWRDTAWFQRILGEARDDPPPPTPLRALGPGILDEL